MKNFPDWFFDKADWQEKTLCEVAEVFDGTHQTPNYADSGVKFVSVENIKNIYDSKKFIGEEDFEKNYKIYPQKGDILMTRIGDIGTPALVSTDEKIAYYVSLALLKPTKINSGYLLQAIQSNFFQTELKNRSLQTAYPKKINKNEIEKIKIKFPPLEVQKKIAEYFTSLDKAINAQDLKLKSWRDAKKAMLQKIFAQEFYFITDNGEKFPAWQEKNFDDIFKDVSEKNFPDLEVLTIMQGYGTVPRRNSGIDIKFTEESKKNYKKVSEGDFIIHLRSFQGGFEMANSEGIVSPAYTILKNKLPIAENFYKNYFRSHNFISGKLAKFVEGIRDGRQINYNQLKTVKIPFPCLEEQKKIADYFSSLDKIIDAENKMLESLRQMKRGLLQKLFV